MGDEEGAGKKSSDGFQFTFDCALIFFIFPLSHSVPG